MFHIIQEINILGQKLICYGIKYNIKGNIQIIFAWKCHNIAVCVVAVLIFRGVFSVNVVECSSSSPYILLFWISLFISGTLSWRNSCWMSHGIKRISPPSPNPITSLKKTRIVQANRPTAETGNYFFVSMKILGCYWFVFRRLYFLLG